MSVKQVFLGLLVVLSSASSYAGQWKVCLNSLNGDDPIKKYARTLDECKLEGRKLARELCQQGEVDLVLVEGQFTVGNPQYFSFQVNCLPKPGREPILQ